MRTNYSIKNSITSFVSNIISFIFLFISQTLFVKILGIEYNGLNGLFSNILTFLNLFELGIGNAIVFNLYKYIKKNDNENIKSLIKFYKKSYAYISIIIFVIGLSFLPFLKIIINDISLNINIHIVYILFLINTISTYLISYKRNLLYAYQRNYIINIVTIIYTIILNVLQIVALFFTKNYYLYLIIKIVCILIENIIITIITNKKYPYILEKNVNKLDSNIKHSIIIKVKALFIHKASSAVTNGTDSILISAFLGIKAVGLYTNYYYIINTIRKIFSSVITSTGASVGNLLVENNYEKNYQIFKKIKFLNLWIAIFTSICLLLLIEPFITLWIGEKYLLDRIVLIILVLNFFQRMMKSTFGTFKDSAGLWVEDKYIPVLQLLINIILSIILINRIGLVGVFIGTLISSFVLWFYSYPKLVYKKVFNKSIKKYIIDFSKDISVFIIISIICYCLNQLSSNIFISAIISFIMPNIILYLFYRNTNEFKYYINIIKSMIRKSMIRKKH